MAYPGNHELSAQAQERVMTAFRQVMSKLQDGQRDEALIGLDFVLRLDPVFAPGLEIQKQLASGEQEFDLSSLLSNIDAPSTDEINMLLIEAVEEFNQHNYVEAQKKVTQVLLELPGHTEARNLQEQITSAMKVETQVGHFLAQAREALDRGDPQEAVNFVVMAQALDPHHKGIQAMLGAINREEPSGAASIPESRPPTTEEALPASADAPDIAAAAPEAPDLAPAAPPASDVSSGGFDGGFSFDVEDEFDIASDEDNPSPNETIALDSWDVDGAFEEPAAEQLPEAEAQEAGAESAQEAVPATLFKAPVSEEQAPDSFSSGDVADLFSTGSSDDVAAPPAAEPELPPPPAMDFSEPPELPSFGDEAPAPVESSGPAFDESSGSDISDLFEAPADPPSAPEKGQLAEAASDNQAHDLLDAARRAWSSGSPEEAKVLVEEVLGSVPNNVEAIELMAQIEAEMQGAAPPPPELGESMDPGDPMIPPPPSLADDDLFDSDFEEGDDDLAEPEPPSEPPPKAAAPEPTPVLKRSISLPGGELLEKLPWRMIVMAAGGVILLLAATLVGLRLFSDDDAAVRDTREITEVLNQADELFKKGNQSRAIELLTAYEAEGLEQQRINKRIDRYKKEMAPPTPTPIPQALISARELFEKGQWFSAYEQVVRGLAAHDNDAELSALRDDILKLEPGLNPLFSLLREKDFAEAAILAKDLGDRHPDQPEIGALQDRCLFNAALAGLRSYNLAAARSHLLRLQTRQPDDEEVQRILRFVTSYTNRPVDMQLEIFVGSLENR